MILNGYAVLMGFVGLLRLLLGLLVLALGLLAWHGRAGTVSPSADQRDALEDRGYLVFLLTLLLVGLDLVSWPLFYLLLDSYVPEWPGVMCIYGVMQVGRDSLGSAQHLPGLLELLQLTKPALVFAGGAWFVLYLLDRQTRTGPLLGRLFLVLLPLGLLAVADAAAELTYLAIPKKEEFPSGGCCTAHFQDGVTARLARHGSEGGPWWLHAAYYGSNATLILALFACVHRTDRSPAPVGLAVLQLMGVVVLLVGGVFLFDVAAPTLLRLPHHHCPYDLIPQVPEAIVAVTLFLAGGFFLGWASVAWWAGNVPETAPLLGPFVGRLLRLSAWCHLASLVMFCVEMALA